MNEGGLILKAALSSLIKAVPIMLRPHYPGRYWYLLT